MNARQLPTRIAAAAPTRAEIRLGLRWSWRVLTKALARLWGRDVMLYTGGVSFFALLAVFPALTILVGLYGAFVPPEAAARQATAWAFMLPYDAQPLFQDELMRLVTMNKRAISLQSGFALVIGAYAAHRGFKALLAGLSFIHEEDKPHGFVRFNVMALVVAVAGFALIAVLATAILLLKAVTYAMGLASVAKPWLGNDWLFVLVAMTLGLSLLYRYAMSSEFVRWRASIPAGLIAALLSLAASGLSAVYVGQVANLGATYGSVGAVVVFLVWLSWNVNVVFLGGALATEIELALQPKVAGLATVKRRARPSATTSTSS